MSKLTGIIQTILIIFLLIASIIYLGTCGLIGWIIFTIIWGCLQLWINKDVFMVQVRYLETMIWGKPLDRDMWGRGEFKNNRRKIKLVWKKKNNPIEAEIPTEIKN